MTEENADQKYQKLSLEFARLRNEIPILREKLEEERNRNNQLEEEIEKKNDIIKKLKFDNESLSFRNEQMSKRVENLQSNLDATTATFAQAKAKKKHKEANLRLFGSPAMEPCTSGDVPVNSSQLVIEQELERKLAENAHLHNELFDMEKQHETVVMEFTTIVKKLETENELMKKKLMEKMAKGIIDEDDEVKKFMINDDFKEEEKKELLYKILNICQKGLESLIIVFSQLDLRSTIYPCDATLESVPEGIHLFGVGCGKLAEELKDITAAMAIVQMRLQENESFLIQETKEKLQEIKMKFTTTFNNIIGELISHLNVCIRKECDAPWCNSQLDQLNSQFEKIFEQSFQKLINLFLIIDKSEFNIQTELVEVKKLFHKLKDIFGKKIFIENHQPTASKKLRNLNDSIEKGLLQFVQVISQICNIFDEKNLDIWTILVSGNFDGKLNGKKMSILEKQTSIIEESNLKLNEFKCKLNDLRKKEELYENELSNLKKEITLKNLKLSDLESKITIFEKEKEVLKNSTMDVNELRKTMIKGKLLDDFSVVEYYFCEELKKTVAELENVKGTVSRYRKDIDDMTLVLQKLDIEQNESKSIIDAKESEIQKLKDELEITRRSYEEQIQTMSDHLAALNDKIVEKSEKLVQMNGESNGNYNPSSSSSTGGSLIRKMVRK